jgi:signal transduction histidine kinase
MLAVPALQHSGEPLTTEFSIVMLKDEQGQPQGVAAIMRDISARRAEEKNLRDRLASLEAGQVGR